MASGAVLAPPEPQESTTDSSEFFTRLVESSPDVYFRLRVRPDVRMEYINQAAERILGHPIDTLRTADLAFLRALFTDDEWDDVLDVSAGRRFHPVALRRVRRADGTIAHVETHNRPVYDDAGTIVALEGTIRDVSDRENAVTQLRRVEERQRIITESRDVTDEVHLVPEVVTEGHPAAPQAGVERQLGVRNPYQFTFREFTVLDMVSKGVGDKEIAVELGVVPSTVHKHVSNILAKMRANSRTEAGVRAVREGLVST